MKFHAEVDVELERRELSNTIMVAEHGLLSDFSFHSLEQLLTFIFKIENEEVEDWEYQQIRKAGNFAPLKKPRRISLDEDDPITKRDCKRLESILGPRPTLHSTERLKEINVESIKSKLSQKYVDIFIEFF